MTQASCHARNLERDGKDLHNGKLIKILSRLCANGTCLPAMHVQCQYIWYLVTGAEPTLGGIILRRMRLARALHPRRSFAVRVRKVRTGGTIVLTIRRHAVDAPHAPP